MYYSVFVMAFHFDRPVSLRPGMFFRQCQGDAKVERDSVSGSGRLVETKKSGRDRNKIKTQLGLIGINHLELKSTPHPRQKNDLKTETIIRAPRWSSQT